MRLSRKNLLGRVALQLVMTLLAVLQQVALVSFFATHWTGELYSSFLVMTAVSNLLLVADFGLHSHTYLSLQKGLSSQPPATSGEIGEITSQSVFAYSVIALSIIAAGAAACAILPLPGLLHLSGASDLDLRLGLFFSIAAGAGLVCSFCFSAMLRAVDALNAVTGVRMAHIIGGFLLTILALRLGYGIVAVAGTVMAAQWILNAVLALMCWRLLPGFLAAEFIKPFSQLRASLAAASRYVIPLSSDLVLLNIPTLAMGILGRPAAEIVLFTLTRIITSFIRQIATFATHPTANEVSQLWMQGKGDGARRAILVSLAIAGSGTGVLTGFFAVFSLDIISVWTGGAYRGDPVMLALQLSNIALAFPAIAASTALIFTDQPGYITRSRLWQIAALTMFCFSLGHVWGARGISAAVLAAEFLIACVPLTLHLKSRFAIPGRSFYSACAFPFLACFLVSLTAAMTVRHFFPAGSIPQIAIAGALWLPLPALTALWIFFFSTKPQASAG
jgi:hypothetical protein